MKWSCLVVVVVMVMVMMMIRRKEDNNDDQPVPKPVILPPVYRKYGAQRNKHLYSGGNVNIGCTTQY